MSIQKTKEKGITLIALVITIIVILVLAGVTISTMQGNSGIISKADESKSQTERKEVIEKAKMTISEKVVDNGGNELTRSELKEILEQYFINVPEDYTLETILKTKEENGKYEIKVSEIYDRDIMTENEETDGSTEVVPPTSSTNVENGSSGNTGSNSNTGNSTGGTGNTNSENTSGGNSNNTGNSGSNSTEIDVTKVEMDKQTATVDINGENTVQLNAKVIPSNANKNTEITWTSKKTAVASVNQKGLVTGKTVGNSMIMATSQNGYSADCLVVCQAKITGIKINPVTANMIVGQKITLTATTSPEIVTEKVTWKSRNEDVAKVDNNGNVTGIGKGVVEIIAQNPGGTIQAVCTVTVKINPTGIRLNYSKLVLDKNSSNIPKLEATILPDTTYVNNSIVWDSSNKNVVTVENGNLTLIGNGEAQITVTTQNGYTAQCSITVITPITSLAVSPTSETLYVGNTVQLTGTVNPSNTTESTLWTSSNTDVATVSDTGLVTAKSAGTATITFKNSSGTKLDSCTITVEDYKKALETESYVGYYADVDGDGTVDGIIFADLLHGKTGQWGDVLYDDSTYTIPTIESTKVKSYKISQKDYTNQLGGTAKILTQAGEGENRFYVLALTDIGTGTYSLGCSMLGTTATFGSGKTNTQTLIGQDLNSSLKEQIQPKVNKGWFIPSKEEWSAFGEELGVTKSNYSAKGLNGWYWSSSQYKATTNNAWYVGFDIGGMDDYGTISSRSYVRLVTAF